LFTENFKFAFYFELGIVRKRCPQFGGVCPVRTFFGQGSRGFFRCRRPHFWM